AFIVADKVVLETRRAGLGSEHGVRWESGGEGDYTIETLEKKNRGTVVTLHLREGEDEVLDGWCLRYIVTRYSDHIDLPIEMKKEVLEKAEGDEKEENSQEEWEQVNKATALWTLPKNEITEEDYKAFYKHVAHDFEDPLTWTHNRVEGKLE